MKNNEYIYCVLIIVSLLFLFYFLEPNNNHMKSKKSTGIDLKYIDNTTSPKNDFYRYVNGNWLDSVQIPEDQTVWGGFYELDKKTNQDVLDILESAMNNPLMDRNSDQGKAISLYECFMDTNHRIKLGISPIETNLSQVTSIQEFKDLESYMINIAKYGDGPFLGLYVGVDKKNSSKHVSYLGGGSLGLPDRDYYLLDSFKDIRDSYLIHIQRMFDFVGYNKDEAINISEQILEFETRIASSKMDKVDRRDPIKTYNPQSISEIKEMLPMIDWDYYLKNTGFKGVENIIVSDLNYFKELKIIFEENNINIWKHYLTWNIINNAASSLTTEMEVANWDFYQKNLRGAQKQKPRNERGVNMINWSIGQALGKLYVEERFPAEAKENAREMIDYIIQAYSDRINNLKWMDNKTKLKAIEKLNKINIKIGYPDKWKDYSDLKIESLSNGGSYFNNMKNMSIWSREENLSKLEKEVDKSEWYMSPQIVNAYYNPSNNEIVFPAGILQPPFYDFQADPAVNFGGIGAVIGHEISHGFDDSGADFDGDGNLVKWWSDEDYVKFNALGDSLASQYSAIEVLPDLFINGHFTLGENIGDLGGVNSAYDGLQLYLDNKESVGTIDGFSQNQRFFMSWATIWRIKMRDEALTTRIMTDPHSPGMYRGYVPLQNVQAFYDAFNINEDDKMYLDPEKRVIIW